MLLSIRQQKMNYRHHHDAGVLTYIMRKKDRYIEIVRTSSQPFSSMGAGGSRRIQAILAGHYEQVDISILDTIADLELLTRKKPDLVFLGLKRLPSLWGNPRESADDIWMSQYLDGKGIAYTGSAKAAVALDFNKEGAKACVRRAGLPTAASFTAVPGQYQAANDLPLALPLFVKPLDIGGGKGIGDDSVVRTFAEFQQKVASIAAEHASTSLVERYLTGREFSVAILEDPLRGEPLVMPVEIITKKNARGDRVLGLSVKHENDEQVIGVTDRHIKATVCALAMDVYNALGARDLGRIDIRMDAAGNAYFLEANFMPAPGTRYFAGACRINKGLDYESVLLDIVELGLSRTRTRDITRVSV